MSCHVNYFTLCDVMLCYIPSWKTIGPSHGGVLCIVGGKAKKNCELFLQRSIHALNAQLIKWRNKLQSVQNFKKGEPIFNLFTKWAVENNGF